MRLRLAATFALAACGTSTSPGFSTGPGATSAPASTSGSSTGGDASSTGPEEDSAGSAASGSTGTLRDVGTAQDFGPVQPPGCKGKVDLLFLISREGNMGLVQEQLLASLPGFVDTIEAKLEGFDVHIMAANPDGSWPGYNCEHAWWGCKMYFPNCGPKAQDYQCGVYQELWTQCDEELGAGLTFNAGADAANKLCDLHGGNRYIISGEPNMKEALECIAKVGWSGPDPPIGDALIAALGWQLNGKGGCNEGFLREDALLVVTIIANTEDEKSKTYAKQQYEAILAAKKDPSAVVMLAIVPFPLEEGEPEVPGCIYDDNNAGNFRDLLERFPYQSRGDACAPSYAPFFEEAVGMIGEACGSFIPQ